MPDLRVLIVADDPLARAGLATLLTQNAGWSVVRQVPGHVDVLAGLRLYQPIERSVHHGSSITAIFRCPGDHRHWREYRHSARRSAAPSAGKWARVVTRWDHCHDTSRYRAG